MIKFHNIMKLIVIILSILLANSCSDDTVPIQIVETPSTPITFTFIGRGDMGGDGEEIIIEESHLVITNASDWQNLIEQMNTFNDVSDSFTEINIDFDSFMVIAVILEVKFSLWHVEITNLEETETSVIFSITETPTVASSISQPYHIVKIPITDKSILFQ